MSRQSRSKVELIQLGSAHVATSIHGREKKKLEIIETLNSVNRHKRRLLHWQLLTASHHPSPNICLSFYRVELGDQGKPRWRMVDNGALLVQLTSNGQNTKKN